MAAPAAYAILLPSKTPEEALRLLEPCLFLRRDDRYLLSTRFVPKEGQPFVTLTLRHVDTNNTGLLTVLLPLQLVLAVEVLASETDVQRIGFHS